jgi:hypothetical protein
MANAFGDTRFRQADPHGQQIAPNTTIRKTGRMKTDGRISAANSSLHVKIKAASLARNIYKTVVKLTDAFRHRAAGH